MKTLSNISNMHLNDAFRFASSISGRSRNELTLGDVYTTFNTIAQVVSKALGETTTSDAVPQPKKRGRPAGSSKARANAQPKKRGRPAGSGGAKAATQPKKRGRPVGSGKVKAAPSGETMNKSGSPRAPRGQRKGIIVDVIRACGGEMAYAAVAKAVIAREGVEDAAAVSVHNAVYSLLNKMVSDGEAETISDSPKTIRLKGKVAEAKHAAAQAEGELELVTS